eukprot:1759997-Amphidinium_carterae.1
MIHRWHHHHFMIIKMLWWRTRLRKRKIQGRSGLLPTWRTLCHIGQVLMIEGVSLIRSAIGMLPERLTLYLMCLSLCTSTAHADNVLTSIL